MLKSKVEEAKFYESPILKKKLVTSVNKMYFKHSYTIHSKCSDSTRSNISDMA